MFDDVTYLKLFVSPDEPWDAIIRQMYTKRMTKKDVKKHVAYAVVNGMQGKITNGKEAATLAACDSFVQYETTDWVTQYDAMIAQDKKIVALRNKLLSIPYLTPEAVLRESKAFWILLKLEEKFSLTREQACAEVSVYGMGNIEAFLPSMKYRYSKFKGRYHFVKALHEFADDYNQDLIVRKKHESSVIAKSLKRYETKIQKPDTVSDREDNMQRDTGSSSKSQDQLREEL